MSDTLAVDAQVTTLRFTNKHNVIYSSDFEEIVEKTFNSVKPKNIPELGFDLSSVRYIDVVCLVNICAFVQKLREVNSEIVFSLKLPRDSKVLAFLSAWNFDKAIENAIGDSLLDLLLEEEDKERYEEFFIRKIFSEDDVSSLLGKFQWDSLNELTNDLFYINKFFSIKSFPLDNKNDIEIDSEIDFSIVNRVTNRWKEKEIEVVLNKVLKDKNGKDSNGLVPSRIIFECLTNALRHPNGTLLQTTSRFIKKNVNPKVLSDNFSIVFWDNGASMYSVLKSAYEETGNIKANLQFNKKPQFNLTYSEEGKEVLSNAPIDSNIIPNEKHKADFHWLLATFFPGVSSDPTASKRKREVDEKVKGTIFDNPGMGLYLLLNTVADVFGGKIVVRTGKYLMSITPSGKKNFDYNVKIKKLSSSVPEFKGNLIAIHLPLCE